MSSFVVYSSIWRIEVQKLKWVCIFSSHKVNMSSLQWARDQFEGLFKQTPENVNLFLR